MIRRKASWLSSISAFIFVVFLAACASKGLKPDSALAALGIRDTQQAGDATVIVEGTSQPPVGFHYIRMQEGASAIGSVFLQVPPAECNPNNVPCISWTVIRPDGSDFGEDVPRGTTRVDIPYKKLFNSDTVELGARGPFGVILTVKWIDNEGRDRESRAEGEIYVRVVKNGYRGLQDTPTNGDFVWEWSSENKIYRMTSGLRAYAGEK